MRSAQENHRIDVTWLTVTNTHRCTQRQTRLTLMFFWLVRGKSCQSKSQRVRPLENIKKCKWNQLVRCLLPDSLSLFLNGFTFTNRSVGVEPTYWDRGSKDLSLATTNMERRGGKQQKSRPYKARLSTGGGETWRRRSSYAMPPSSIAEITSPPIL